MSFTKYDSVTEKYKKVKNEGIGVTNINTFYSFDHVFSIIEKYLKYKTECYLDRPLKYMELPDRSVANQGLNRSDTARMSNNLCPRGIMLYNIDPNDQEIVNIPTLKSHFTMNNGLFMELESVKKRSIDAVEGTDFNYFRDIDLVIKGSLNWTSATIIYTVLFDNKIESIETMKQFKRDFPLNELHDVYRFIMKTSDTTGKTDNTGKITNEIELIPHTMKTLIPERLITLLKDPVEITDMENSDDVLFDLIKKYSFNGFGREVNGSTGKTSWFSRYTHVPILVPLSIDRSDNVKDMSNTSAVRVEFQLNYLEISAYRLNARLNILSPENPNNVVSMDKDGSSAVVPPSVYKPIEINGCVEHFTLDLAYERDDETIVVDSETNEDMVSMKVPIIPIIRSRDKYLDKYIQYIFDTVMPEEDNMYYNILIKHQNVIGYQTPTDENTIGAYYSYDDMCCYDSSSTVDQEVKIICYVNMEHYSAWKKKVGLVENDNLSTKYLK